MRVLTRLLFCALVTSAAASAEDAKESHAPSPAAATPTPCAQTKNPLQRDSTPEYVEVWIDLSTPPLSSAQSDRDARAALRARIQDQQDKTIAQLAALGAEEFARVVDVRNAIAVRMPASRVEEARALPGVVKVRPVQHRKRMTQCSSRN